MTIPGLSEDEDAKKSRYLSSSIDEKSEEMSNAWLMRTHAQRMLRCVTSVVPQYDSLPLPSPCSRLDALTPLLDDLHQEHPPVWAPSMFYI